MSFYGYNPIPMDYSYVARAGENLGQIAGATVGKHFDDKAAEKREAEKLKKSHAAAKDLSTSVGDAFYIELKAAGVPSADAISHKHRFFGLRGNETEAEFRERLPKTYEEAMKFLTQWGEHNKSQQVGKNLMRDIKQGGVYTPGTEVEVGGTPGVQYSSGPRVRGEFGQGMGGMLELGTNAQNLHRGAVAAGPLGEKPENPELSAAGALQSMGGFGLDDKPRFAGGFKLNTPSTPSVESGNTTASAAEGPQLGRGLGLDVPSAKVDTAPEQGSFAAYSDRELLARAALDGLSSTHMAPFKAMIGQKEEVEKTGGDREHQWNMQQARLDAHAARDDANNAIKREIAEIAAAASRANAWLRSNGSSLSSNHNKAFSNALAAAKALGKTSEELAVLEAGIKQGSGGVVTIDGERTELKDSTNMARAQAKLAALIEQQAADVSLYNAAIDLLPKHLRKHFD